MDVLIKVSHTSNSAHLHVKVGAHEEKLFFNYKEDVVTDPETLCYLPLTVLAQLYSFIPPNEKVFVQITGVGLNDHRLAIYHEILWERRIANMDYLEDLHKKHPELVSPHFDWALAPKVEFPLIDIHHDHAPVVVARPSLPITGSLFSGGKESSLNKALLEKFFPDYIHQFYYSRFMDYNSAGFSRFLSRWPEVKSITTNINHMRSFVAKLFNLPAQYYRHDLMFSPYFLPVMQTLQVKYWLMGNEMDCTRLIPYKGLFHNEVRLYHESLFYESYFTRMMQEWLPEATYFSQISHVCEVEVLKALCTISPEAVNKMIACWHVGAKTDWCGRCDKCVLLTRAFDSVRRFNDYLSVRPKIDTSYPSGFRPVWETQRPERVYLTDYDHDALVNKSWPYRYDFMPKEFVERVRLWWATHTEEMTTRPANPALPYKHPFEGGWF
jgi:hypothetical protein